MNQKQTVCFPALEWSCDVVGVAAAGAGAFMATAANFNVATCPTTYGRHGATGDTRHRRLLASIAHGGQFRPGLLRHSHGEPAAMATANCHHGFSIAAAMATVYSTMVTFCCCHGNSIFSISTTKNMLLSIFVIPRHAFLLSGHMLLH